MNNIDIIYKNINFNANDSNYEFNTDSHVLNELLKRVNITNNVPQSKATIKALSNDEKNNFQTHPRNFSDESITTVDTVSEHYVNNAQIDSEDKCNDYLLNVLPSYQITTSELNRGGKGPLTERNKLSNSKSSNMKERMLDSKLNALIVKINAWIQEIGVVVGNGLPPLEGAEDENRREKRATEFASRFARNYLYQLNRQLTMLQKYVPVPKPLALRQQLINTGHTVLHALQAYCNHIPKTVVTSNVHQKFQTLLTHISDLCLLFKRFEFIHISKSVIDDIYINAANLTQIIDTNLIAKAQTIQMKALPVNNAIRKRGASQQVRKKNTVRNRLAMYKSTASVVKMKPKVWKPITKRKSICKITPSVTNVANNNKIVNVPVNRKKASSLLIQPIQDENTIETMVESVRLDEERTEPEQIKTQLESLLHNLLLRIERKQDDVSNSELVGKLKVVLNQLQDGTAPREHHCTKTRVTTTGAPNAKLICIENDMPCTCSVVPEPQPLTQEEQQQQQPPPTQPLQELLSKALTMRIIQYKLDYHHYIKSNSLYRKKSNGSIQPWHLINKLADNLLDHLCASILPEFQLNHIVDVIYTSEFM